MWVPGQADLSKFRAQTYNLIELTCRASHLESINDPLEYSSDTKSYRGFSTDCHRKLILPVHHLYLLRDQDQVPGILRAEWAALVIGIDLPDHEAAAA